MATPFCPGYGAEPYATLVADAPDVAVYPGDAFRVEWGPIFHRGRLDGSARVLVLGQDPASHETILRRILVGTAGKRVQGFLAHLGITRSYVLINTFLYSVYGQFGGEKHKKDPAIAAYRNRWIAALLDNNPIEAVVAFGSLADVAWQLWLASPEGQARPVPAYQHVAHPTSPEGSGGTAAQKKAATKAMLKAYNTAIAALGPAVAHPDTTEVVPPYGDGFLPQDLPVIPVADLPAGMPAWMGSTNTWAVRTGATAEEKRRTVKVTAPASAVP
ncbi:MAG TPA: uracil-DNA glycosylase family protein [Thermoanaerobaculia bacterium]|nr:uracil-DNA glycosylase family protein [Thermoanaerobaculia bacterium]